MRERRYLRPVSALPLSDVCSGRHLVLRGAGAEAARKAVRNGRRWAEEQRLGELARERFLQLCLSDSRRLVYFDPEETKEVSERRVHDLIARSLVCVDQEGLDEALARPRHRLVFCYSERGDSFQAVIPAGHNVVFFGNPVLDLTLEPSSEVHLLDRTRAKMTALKPEPGEHYQPRVTLSEQAEAEVSGWVTAQGHDDSRILCLGEDVRVTISDRATAELGTAASVWANSGTTVVVGEGAKCPQLEVDDYLWKREENEPPRIVDEQGRLLLSEGIPEGQYSVELTPTVTVCESIPF